LRAPKASGRDLRKIGTKLKRAVALPELVAPQIWHTTVPQIPFRRLPFVNAVNEAAGLSLVRRAMKHLGFRHPLLWFAAPDAAAFLGHLDEEFVVYYCTDDHASLPDINSQEIGRMDELLTRRADQVFVCSPALLGKKRALNSTTEYSPHGVDVSLFGRASDASLPVAPGAQHLRHPVIGFFGLVEAWFDVELMAFLAKARPAWTFLIIGRTAVDLGELRQLSNVVFTGVQPYESLPDWARAFDVAIIPFRQNELVRNVNPLKLREYLATGKPVVTIWMPEVDQFAHCIGIARNREQFLAQIEQGLKTDSASEKELRIQAVAGMTWDARVAAVLEIVKARMQTRATGQA
jgi:glycosyltransferase involved in cell wall biosynthesis